MYILITYKGRQEWRSQKDLYTILWSLDLNQWTLGAFEVFDFKKMEKGGWREWVMPDSGWPELETYGGHFDEK